MVSTSFGIWLGCILKIQNKSPQYSILYTVDLTSNEYMGLNCKKNIYKLIVYGNLLTFYIYFLSNLD